MPTTTDVPTPAPRDVPARSAAIGILVDLQAMKAAVADPNIVKLDTRDVDEWIADSSVALRQGLLPAQGPHPRRGLDRVVPHDEADAAGPMFKSSEEILAECATVGVTPKTPVVLYCFKGARASNTLVALKEAGIENVTLYFGSWNEWSRDPSLPIETRAALQDRGRDQRRGLSGQILRSRERRRRHCRTARLPPTTSKETATHGHV